MFHSTPSAWYWAGLLTLAGSVDVAGIQKARLNVTVELLFALTGQPGLVWTGEGKGGHEN